MKAKVMTWLTNIENGNINSKTEIILNYIIRESEFGGVDIHTMRIDLGIAHQSLTAILSILQDNGIVKVVDVIEIMNNHYSVFKYVTEKKERNYLSQEREREKVLNWLKQGFVKYDKYFSPEVSTMVSRNYTRIKKEQGTGVQLSLF
jgi:hypothetical protein